jgi:hypothetical protein
MKNKLLGVSAVAAVTGLMGGAPASAAVEPVRMQAQSFSELLQPIPNATEKLQIADMQAAREEPRLIEAQYVNHHHHHHHHHNRRWYLRNGYYWYGGAWVLRPRNNHHHHHHHHHNNYPNNPPPPRPY